MRETDDLVEQRVWSKDTLRRLGRGVANLGAKIYTGIQGGLRALDEDVPQEHAGKANKDKPAPPASA